MQPTVERTLRCEPGDGGVPRPTTFILPDLPWAALLVGITRDARAGDVIEVHTQAMYDEAVRRLREARRDDVTVALRPLRGVPLPAAHRAEPPPGEGPHHSAYHPI